MIGGCNLNNKIMRNIRRDKVYQCLVIDLGMLGKLSREECEMLLGYSIPDSLVLPNEQNHIDDIEDEDEDEDSSGGSSGGSSSVSGSSDSDSSSSDSNSSSSGSTSSMNNITLGKGVVACQFINRIKSLSDDDEDSSSSSESSSSNDDSDVLESLQTGGISVMYFPTKGTVSVIGGSAQQMEMVRNFVKEKDTDSKDTAKERLHLVLMQDRANVSADFLELMKQEIIDVIKKDRKSVV